MRNPYNNVSQIAKNFPRLRITDLEALPERVAHVYDPGILVEGCSHHLVAPYDSGKTFLALICAAEFLGNSLRVLYLDYENRAHSIRERLGVIGTDRISRSNFLYINRPNLDLSQDSQSEWKAFLAHHEPDLIVFDSLNGFLSNAARDENSSTGFQEWCNVYLKVSRALEMTTLVIDHTGWDGGHSRGTSRKPDEFDIVWKVHVKRKFSRSKVGQLDLKLVKDRDPLISGERLTFNMGGHPFRWQVKSAHTAGDDLSEDQERTFELVKQNSENEVGTPRKDINELFNGSKSKADNAIKHLCKENLIYQREGSALYWTVDPSSRFESDSSPDENDSEHTLEVVAPKDIVERKEPLTEGDILDQLGALDYSQRGMEVLEAVALAWLDNPLVTMTGGNTHTNIYMYI
jgi:hypothetical protein